MKEILNNVEKIMNSKIFISFNSETNDNRLSLISKEIESFENKDTKFYEELIKVLVKIFEEKEENSIFRNVTDDKDNKIINFEEEFQLPSLGVWHINNIFKKNIFNYICILLSENEDIVLDYETLNKLFNCHPTRMSMLPNNEYIKNNFGYKELAITLEKNQTLKKSNITPDQIYQLLIDSFHIDEKDIFTHLISVDDFNKNHEKIDEFLKHCNGRTFAIVTNIIKNNYDENYDCINLLRQKDSKVKIEDVIIASLNYSELYNLICELLQNKDLNINYDYNYSDYFGYSSLKDLLAISNNPTIIKELLKNKSNIKDVYQQGSTSIYLYHLYALIGEYQKALDNFNKKYIDYPENKKDLCCFYTTNDDNVLTKLISNLCKSFIEKNISSSDRLTILNEFMNNDKINFIDQSLIKIIRDNNILSEQELSLFEQNLIDRYQSGNLNFIRYKTDLFSDEYGCPYKVEILNGLQVQEIFPNYNINQCKIYKFKI